MENILAELGQEMNNIEIEVDDGDDDEDRRDEDGAMDGGVAANPEDGGGNSKRRSSECDLVRVLSFFEIYVERSTSSTPIWRKKRKSLTLSSSAK